MTRPPNRSSLPSMRASAVKRAGSPFVGVLLILLGLAWLLRTAGVWTVAWPVVLSLLLLLVGVGLMVGGRRWHTRGLIAAGLLLTLVLATNTSGDLVIGSGVGERIVTPTRGRQLGSENLAIGALRIHLEDLNLAEGEIVELEANVAFGELTVTVPPGIALVGKARVGIGEVRVDGMAPAQGVGVEADLPEPLAGLRRIRVDLNVLVGGIKIVNSERRN